MSPLLGAHPLQLCEVSRHSTVGQGLAEGRRRTAGVMAWLAGSLPASSVARPCQPVRASTCALQRRACCGASSCSCGLCQPRRHARLHTGASSRPCQLVQAKKCTVQPEACCGAGSCCCGMCHPLRRRACPASPMHSRAAVQKRSRTVCSATGASKETLPQLSAEQACIHRCTSN